MPSTYPFDPTGLLPSNKIDNELKTPGVGNGVDGYLIVPNATPFYEIGHSVVNSAGVTLVQGTDYILTHKWVDADTNTGRKVYGGILLLGTTAVGTVRLNYQTIGGTYVDNRANAIVDGLFPLAGALTVDWTTAPTTFPSTPHNLLLSGATGMTEVLAAIDRITVALNQPLPAINMADIQDLDVAFVNPLLAQMAQLTTAVNNNNGLTAQLSTAIADITQLQLDIVATNTIVAAHTAKLATL